MSSPTQQSTFNPQAIRTAFPILATEVNGHPLVYLDNAATTQKPSVVLEVMDDFFRCGNANIHRGVHSLSQKATESYETGRATVAGFLNADPKEIVFVRGATEAINLVAASFLEPKVRNHKGRVLITGMEHHANIVPWQLLARKYDLQLDVVPVLADGTLDRAACSALLAQGPLLFGLVHVSNALGTINPAAELIAEAHAHGVPVLLDAAQSAPHFSVDVKALDCDFCVFSGHKLFGPTGIGVLYGKYGILDGMEPYQGGGDMIEQVSFAGTTFKHPPERFEAGTPAIAQVLGLAAAVRYLGTLDRAAATQHEDQLLAAAEEGIRSIRGARIIGTAKHKTGVVSFLIDGVHPHDIGTFLDVAGIAIRTGHHCAQPLMQGFNISGTARASFAFYNTLDEVEKLIAALHKVARFFGN